MKVKSRFTSDDFEDGSYGGAVGKAKTANAIVRFIESGFDRSKFTKQAYSGGLMYMFGHIAHYNIHGFYAEWFSSNASIAEWCKHIIRFPEYGDNDCTLVEVERVIREYVIETDTMHKYADAAWVEQDTAERAEYARLRAKFGTKED